MKFDSTIKLLLWVFGIVSIVLVSAYALHYASTDITRGSLADAYGFSNSFSFDAGNLW
ncbi:MULTISPECIES: hypothetical protein [Holospora]|uniref:Uncharacterized protein n=2 Tax=Holospora TaxID=44747 RepID=A0A061JG36_9PROT|nr:MULTISPECIES: hypothetical protein [Holospora]ETZ04861.1 hypothetical protein K737_300715 [Holospora undulata HU1]GAJ46504.1 hypothetical protein HE1_00839 [Holospora elegans E1]